MRRSRGGATYQTCEECRAENTSSLEHRVESCVDSMELNEFRTSSTALKAVRGFDKSSKTSNLEHRVEALRGFDGAFVHGPDRPLAI